MERIAPERTAIRKGRGAEVWAALDGTPITRREVESHITAQLEDFERRLFNLRKRSLDVLINRIILKKEAERRNLTLNQLIDIEVKSKIKPVSEEEVRKQYLAKPARDRRNVDLQIKRMQKSIYAKRYQSALMKYLDKLKKNHRIEIFLEEPRVSIHQVSTNDDPWMGDRRAPITLVEFTDFQCSSCAAFHHTLLRVLREFKGKVKLIVRDYPFGGHEFAEKAAEASECAHEQGKYWEYQELLYNNQQALDTESLKSYADFLHLDMNRFIQCVESGKYAEEVRKDKSDGRKAGVVGTPTLFLNGKKVIDLRYGGLRNELLKEIRLAEKKSHQLSPMEEAIGR
ncbi:MAG: thioredoxin domain-containing protein [Deltaproteobacteria bacterium]|nr:thioredoxin domain-containing protein [Deltaproteobacteria bacterium]